MSEKMEEIDDLEKFIRDEVGIFQEEDILKRIKEQIEKVSRSMK